MAKTETIVEDKVYDNILEAFKETKVWYRGSYKHLEETPDEFIEDRLYYYRRYYRRACEDNWRYANWRDVDKYRIYVEYLEWMLQERVDKLFSDFKFVKI